MTIFHLDTLITSLKDRMQARGLSGRQLAAQAGLQPSAVRDILSGKSKDPGVSKIIALADALQCSVDALLQHIPASPALDTARLAEAIALFEEAATEKPSDTVLKSECIAVLYAQMESLDNAPELVKDALKLALKERH